MHTANVTVENRSKMLLIIGLPPHTHTNKTVGFQWHKSHETLRGISLDNLKSWSDTKTWQCVTLCDWIVKIAFEASGRMLALDVLRWGNIEHK